MPRSTKWTKRKQKVFLEVLRMAGNVSAGARAAGVPRTLAYSHRRRDPVFRAEWDSALEAALDDLEGALRRRAVDGVQKPVFYGGKQCGSNVTYSDNLGMFLLRGRRKDVFGEGRSTSANGTESDAGQTQANPRERLMAKLLQMSATGYCDEGKGDRDTATTSDEKKETGNES